MFLYKFAQMTRKLILFPFLTIVLLAPLPFASNRPWSWALLSLLVGLLLVMEVLFSGRNGGNGDRFMVRMLPGVFLVGLIISWIIFQTSASIPPDMAHPLWREVTRSMSMDVTPIISLDREATMSGLTRLLSYCGVFWIGARLGQDPRNAQFMLKSFVLASCLYAVYGLFVHFAGLESILWYDKWAYQGYLTSTFVNKNTYATFAGLGMIASVALMNQILGSGRRDHDTRRALLLEMANRVFSQAWLPVSGIFLMAFSLMLTQSRGGLLSTGFGLLVLFVIFFYTKAVSRKTGLILLACITLFIIVTYVVAGDAMDRRLALASTHSAIRGELFAAIIAAIPSNPYLGTGYGTFEQAFMAYKSYPLSLGNWTKAHNSYLELAFELGIPAAIAVVSLFLWLAGVFIHGLLHRRRLRIFAAIGLSTTALVGAHATVDFSLQIPGLTVCYMLLISIAWAQSWPTHRRAR
jgi:O-antigen ligase